MSAQEDPIGYILGWLVMLLVGGLLFGTVVLQWLHDNAPIVFGALVVVVAVTIVGLMSRGGGE